MRYTYTTFTKSAEGVKRVDITTNFIETEFWFQKKIKAKEAFVEVYDNLESKLYKILENEDDLIDWRTKLERENVWLSPKDSGKTTLTDNNLKTAAAKDKPKTSAIPPIAILALGEAMQDGANKYGRYNWRDSAVSSTVFYDAIMRHLLLWYSGETFAPDSKIHHLAHVMAGCAILIDASYSNVANDDRKPVNSNINLEELRKLIRDA
jgi:hypothetical protein